MTNTDPRKLPVGTPVAVHALGTCRPENHWLGVIERHRYDADGRHVGLTDVCCTDPCGYYNEKVGRASTVETKTLRALPADDEQLVLI